MKYLQFSIFFIFLNQLCFSQNSNADKLRQEGNLESAIESYKLEYLNSPQDGKNTYNLACAYALTFQNDSAFHYLNIGLKKDSSLWPLADTDLFALIDDSRWLEIETQQLKKYQQTNGQLKHPEYAKQLLRLIIKDQALDYYIDQAKSHYMTEGKVPQWYYPLGDFKQKIGKDNFRTWQLLLEKYGWANYSSVGKLAADAPLLIINHHGNESIRQKYLEQIKQACFDQEGSCMEFAKIQDRILVNTNQPQIYGMQFRYNAERDLEPFPIIDPEYVDERRKAIGLEPLKNYLKRKINFDWKVEQKTKLKD